MALALISRANRSKAFWNALIIDTVYQSWIKTYDYAPVVYKYALVS